MSNEDNRVIPISVNMDEVLTKPSEKPVRGDQREVRYLPAIPGTGRLYPAIWTSPYEFLNDEQEKCRLCIVLIAEGPPRPETVGVTVPSAAIERFPLGPVNW